MKTDTQLKKDVLAELEWDPSINATQVGVAVNEGVVLLTGHLVPLARNRRWRRRFGAWRASRPSQWSSM